MDKFQDILGKALPFITEYGLKLLTAIIIFFIGRYIAKKLVKIVDVILQKSNVETTLSRFLENIVYYVLMIVILLACASSLGIDTTSFLAILGTAGLAVGLALKDSLSNFAAGVMIILLKPFKVGDLIDVAGKTGSVKNISIFNTELCSADNKKVLVPNGSIIGDTITNINANGRRRLDMVFGVGYNDNLAKVKEIIKQILANDSRILTDEEAPRVGVLELADNSVNFAVRPWVNSEDYWGVYFDTHEKVKIEFDKAGISIPYPQRDIHILSQPKDS
ncbi:MAG: Small-conductance mechanosensitive channel [uncultured Campylobacterales bacterium]|uniref:Small-conductance mechanosensitive channel n=1 Tax=uncultured Campylobacterales bacterium TaxID=352960 RepID=A0A6S6SD74_9BACT|nr:MAG: Small-conductance mechanosensitive channel [uncultured Campylobacterales bacterium]